MKQFCLKSILTLLLVMTGTVAHADFSWLRALSGAVKAGQAMSLTDQQMAEYVKASVAQMDKQNTVLPASNAYSQRLKRLTAGITSADGIPLNFKVYQTKEVNAFACPDGSVRVFTGLMDIMTDDELLGVIGHEIGHVLKHHSKNALKNQLYTSALRDAIASTGGRAAALSDSQLGAIGETLLNAKYSRTQESEADDCGYDFLVKKGKNPYGMVKAFQKLQSMESSNSGGVGYYVGKMFSSHPDTNARIKRMAARCKKDGYTQTSSTTTKKATTGKNSTTKKAATSKKKTSSKKR